jgi:hypothetical protein
VKKFKQFCNNFKQCATLPHLSSFTARLFLGFKSARTRYIFIVIASQKARLSREMDWAKLNEEEHGFSFDLERPPLMSEVL